MDVGRVPGGMIGCAGWITLAAIVVMYGEYPGLNGPCGVVLRALYGEMVDSGVTTPAAVVCKAGVDIVEGDDAIGVVVRVVEDDVAPVPAEPPAVDAPGTLLKLAPKPWN